MPRDAVNARAAARSLRGRLADTAVTATARSPNSSAATAATSAESTPPE
jgi:hypothetical protein